MLNYFGIDIFKPEILTAQLLSSWNVFFSFSKIDNLFLVEQGYDHIYYTYNADFHQKLLRFAFCAYKKIKINAIPHWELVVQNRFTN